jgi:rubrerythrin
MLQSLYIFEDNARRIELKENEIMGIIFNASEIFEMAIQIEKNGNAFYTKASEKSADPKVGKMFASLAGMEKQHENTFGEMKNTLAGKETELTTYDPMDETILYLQAFASGHVFNLKEDLSAYASGKTDTKDVIKKALSIEKDSIVFYLGLSDLVPEDLGRDKIEKIISEEKGHIRILSEMMRAL